MLTIHHKNVTLLVKPPQSHEQYYNSHYSLGGFYANGSNTLYNSGDIAQSDVPDGYEKVSTNEYFRSLVKRTAMDALTQYLAEHQDDVSIYAEPNFWHLGAIYKAGLGREQAKGGFCEVGCGSVHKGIVKLNIKPHMEGGALETHYDFVNRAFLHTPEQIMRAYYGANVKYVLATSQQEPYKAPQYAELEQINAFLDDKRSVTVILKDGGTYRASAAYTLSASSIISFDENEHRLYLDRNLPDEIKQDKKRRYIGNLAGLKHGHKVLEIDGQRLRGVEYLCGKLRISA